MSGITWNHLELYPAVGKANAKLTANARGVQVLKTEAETCCAGLLKMLRSCIVSEPPEATALQLFGHGAARVHLQRRAL